VDPESLTPLILELVMVRRPPHISATKRVFQRSIPMFFPVLATCL